MTAPKDTTERPIPEGTPAWAVEIVQELRADVRRLHEALDELTGETGRSRGEHLSLVPPPEP
jgi:hypothetical protein